MTHGAARASLIVASHPLPRLGLAPYNLVDKVTT